MKKENIFLIRPFTLILAIGCSMAAASSGLATAWLLGSLVDNIRQMPALLGVLAGVLALQTLSKYGESILFNRYAVLVRSRLRVKIGQNLAYMPAASAGEQRTGDVLARASSDVESVYEFFNSDFKGYITGAISLVFGMGYLFILSWQLATAVMAACITIIAAVLIFNTRIAVAHRAWRTAESEMSVVAEDIAAWQMDIKAMGLENGVVAKFERTLNIWERAFYRRNAIRAWNRLTATLFSVVNIVGIPAFCATRVIDGSFSIGTVLAAIQAANMFTDPLQFFEYYASSITSIRVNLRRVRELTDIPGERTDGSHHPLAGGAPIVEMSDVGFSYGAGTVLKSFSMMLGQGRTVALVGTSGSGKSTVLRLVAGLYEPERGTMRFGGHPAETWNLGAMRRYMAYVPQDAYLFSGSLKANLLCGEDYSDAELREVIDRTRLTPWLVRQPGGWDFDVGERGSRLSGGLRQRVTIARALLRKPALLLLDEPTSALDVATENEVMDAFRHAALGVTCLIVAHRLSSITFADQIIAMRNGHVAETGTHDELMARKGYYYDLYVMQETETRL